MKSQLKKMSMVLLVFFATLFVVQAAPALNVVMANQNPDPVSPGNFVFVNVKLTNVGDEAFKNTKIIFDDNQVFTLASGQERIRETGAIPTYSYVDSSDSFQLEKFKLYVSPDAPLGLNEAHFRVQANGIEYSYDFDILVQDENPTIDVSSFSIDQLEPGQSGILSVKVRNDNSIVLKNVEVSLQLDQVQDSVLHVLEGSNYKKISTLQPNEEKEISFKIVSSPDAKSQPYTLPIEMNYEDALGNTFTQSFSGSVLVYSEPKVLVTLDSQSNFGVGENSIVIALANPGVSSIKGTTLSLNPSDAYDILSSQSQYIGDLNSDDFQTTQFKIYLQDDSVSSLSFTLTYLDSYNVEQEKTITLPLQIYSEEKLKQLGLVQSGSSSSTVIIVLLIVGAIGYVIIKRRKKLSKH
jgi:hypothetical protein